MPLFSPFFTEVPMVAIFSRHRKSTPRGRSLRDGVINAAGSGLPCGVAGLEGSKC